VVKKNINKIRKVQGKNMKKSAIILTGGNSSRLGTDKGLHNFHGKLLISWVIESVRPLTDKIYVVCSNQQASDYQDALPGVQIVLDRYLEKSPLIGLLSGLKAVKTGYSFITACDMPFIKTELVSFLFEKAKGKGGSIVVKPDGWIEPFLSVLDVSYSLAEAERLYWAGDLRIRMVMRNIIDMGYVFIEEVREIDPDLKSLLDLDTLEQLRELTKL
jgi:molybdopterin-guanine dinucleotide biosynthesis protein A